MNHKLFLERARKWYGQGEEEGLHSHTIFHIVKDGKALFFKEAHEIFDEAGNKKLAINLISLACGCTVEDPTAVVVGPDGQPYCQRHVHHCPSCDRPIVPGTGEQVEQVWYHKQPCADLPRAHFQLKQYLAEAFQWEKVRAAKLQNGFTQAQIDNIYERLRLEKEEKETQRALMAAQTHAVYASLRFQDEKIQLEKRMLDQKERALQSQLESERLQRAIGEGRFRLEWAERVSKLE